MSTTQKEEEEGMNGEADMKERKKNRKGRRKKDFQCKPQLKRSRGERGTGCFTRFEVF